MKYGEDQLCYLIKCMFGKMGMIVVESSGVRSVINVDNPDHWHMILRCMKKPPATRFVYLDVLTDGDGCQWLKAITLDDIII